ncbi:hypothetical protein PMI10_02171 [Flavobacterium sp. CF136]|nr:hypothetical protein PMI10_02171 [Flavobacterium sp. CF136]
MKPKFNNVKTKKMKKVAYVFITLLLLSCNSDESAENLLNGKWNWVSSSGGIVGKTMTPASENKTIVLEFYNSIMTKYENGNLVSEDPFSVETRESIMGGERKMIIIDNSEAQSFEIIGKKLYLSDECYDCYQYEYELIK